MSKYLYFIVLLLLSLGSKGLCAQVAPQYSTSSQKAIGLFETAVKLYNSRLEDKALDDLDKALKEDPDFLEALKLNAEILHARRDYEGEIAIYNRMLQVEKERVPATFMYLGEAEFNIGRYKNARNHFSRAVVIKGLDMKSRNKLKSLLANAEFALAAVENPVPFTLVNVGDSVNSMFNDYWPSLTADEQMLIFTRELPSLSADVMGNLKGQEDIFFSSKNNKGGWTKAASLSTNINSQKNEGSQAISTDGRMLVFTACKRPDVIGHCDLYFSERDSSSWSKPVNMYRPINTKAWEAQPCLASDGISLYFVSNRPGGRGGMDIWKSTLTESGTWAEPVNLGDSINTPGDEMSPFIHPDNSTLYFASNGHLGLGGQDMYISHLRNGAWTKPTNLGYPINTYNDEYGLVVTPDGREAFFASNRNVKRGKDIYRFPLTRSMRPSYVSYLKGEVVDSESNQELKADFELSDLETSEVIARASSVNGTGEYLMCLVPNKNYGLSVSKKGYVFHSENLSLKGLTDTLKPLTLNISLQTIMVGRKEILKNVFFEVDSYTLSPQSLSGLRNLLRFLSQNPEIAVEIGGHTDVTGSESHNDSLSELRAKEVYNHLITNGIPGSRLSFKGYGAKLPVTTNDSELGRSLNRRTEFKIVDVSSK